MQGGHAESGRGTMAHVLVADDEVDLRATLRTLLEGEGYTVSEAADGQQTLDAIRASAAPMVVLLDVLMPVIGGIAVLEAVAADPALVAKRNAYLLLTANNKPQLDAAAAVLAQLGVTIVHKPFDIDALLADVAQAAARLP
jgi:CheY-like chemotaxis protein